MEHEVSKHANPTSSLVGGPARSTEARAGHPRCSPGRGLPAEIVADRAFTSRPTLRRIEAGNHRVSIGIYAAVLQALGLLDGLGELADPGKDEAGLALAAQRLPKRVRLRRPRNGDHAE